MHRIVLAVALVAALGGSALGAPRVGVVVLEHEGLTEEQSDELAYDAAAAIAQRIDGDAIAGGTVRGLLEEGVPPGCQDQPACGRKIAVRLKTDEVLFVVIKRAGRKDLDLTFHRIARDPERIPTDQSLRLTGGMKAKREKPLADAVATLYPPGSVVPFVEAPPPPPPPDPAVVEAEERHKKTEREAADSVTRKKWFWPLVVGGVVLVAGGIVAITIVETRPGPTGAPIPLP